MATFLKKSLSEEQLNKLVEHLSFEQLKMNDAVNNEGGKRVGRLNPEGHFMRKGTPIVQ